MLAEYLEKVHSEFRSIELIKYILVAVYKLMS
jgi:hypothetical protein